MTGRDRLVVIGLGSLAVLAAVWLLLVSPERKQAAQLQTQVSAAAAKLATAEGRVANARSAQTSYASAYATVVNLGKAVPVANEVPSLVYELAKASNQKSVDFSSIVSGTGSGTTATASSSTAASKTAGGLTQLPFTFVFNGSYLGLSHLFAELNRFTLRSTSGSLRVNGRLLTVQSIKLAPASTGGESAAHGELTATITAPAYVLPAAQGLTSGATSQSPTGSSSASTVASTPSSGSSPSAPAIVKANP